MAHLLERGEYDRQVNLFLQDRGRMPTQYSYCRTCGGQWVGIPSGFIYDDPMAGWHQDHLNQEIDGYCKPCADGVEASRPVYGGRDSWQIEQRTIEDETYIWDR
jgi:hypothetical protein